MSLAGVAANPESCSGLMYAGVPTRPVVGVTLLDKDKVD
jgi:hypothetical protein